MSRTIELSLLPLLLILLLLSSLCRSQPPTITAKHGVVATDHGRCSEIGSKMLRRGGNAVDAAVAAALCLGVVSPASSGIGGGAFMLVRLRNGATIAYDMRETAPAAAYKDMYGGNATLKERGPLSVAVPGELAGLELAWKHHGSLRWEELVKPAARLADKGFKISPYLHLEMTKTEEAIKADEGLRNMLTSNGNLLRSGDVCYNKQLAKTLFLISKYGVKAFYNGSIAKALVDDVNKAGGILTLRDLKDYKVKIREAVKVHVMGVEMSTMPPPSSGGVALSLILNILELYEDLGEISDSLVSHRVIESLKHALAVRMNLGDPDFVDIRSVVKDMLSKDFANTLKQTIFDNTTFEPSHYGGRWGQLYDHGTSHLSAVDGQGNAVALTTTLNYHFGARYMSPSTGIILNNHMDDFSMPMNTTEEGVLPPAPANFIASGKRPLSSMAPTIIVENGRFKAALGASGGVLIFGTLSEVLVNYLARGMYPLSCVLTPRLYHRLVPNVVSYENWTVPTGQNFEVSAKIRNALEHKHHVLEGFAGTGTVCQFIFQDQSNGYLTGVSDPRKGGYPAGLFGMYEE